MSWRICFITFVAALGGFLFGFDTAVISGTDSFVVPYFKLDDTMWGFTVASALLGTIIGSFLAGFPAQAIGRRDSLFITGVLYLLSSIGCALAPSWWLLVVSRLIGGIGVGLASVLSPMYIAEIAPAAYRGRLVAIAQLNIVIGIVIAYFSNGALVGLSHNWRYMFAAEAIPAVLFIALLIFVPRSPRWLVMKGRDEEALVVLQRVQGKSGSEAEVLSAIKASMQEKEGQVGLLLSKKYRFLTLLAFLFASFNQLSGINVFIYYAPRILEASGLSTKEALWQTFISVGVTNLLFTVLALFIIDKFGRKTLMYTGSLGLILSLFLMSYSYFAQDFSNVSVMLYLVCFIASFALSQGAVIWVFLSEIFPNHLRNHGQSLGAFTHWSWNFIISFSFPPLIACLGGGLVFGFFALMMVLQLLFVFKLMPETRGKTLEQLSSELIRDA